MLPPVRVAAAIDIGHAQETRDGDAIRGPGHVHVIEPCALDKGSESVSRGSPPCGERGRSSSAVIDGALEGELERSGAT